MSIEIERYGVNKEFHFSVLGRNIRAGAVIEIGRANSMMRIDGVGLNSVSPQIANEAIRVVTALAEKKPELIEAIAEIETGEKAFTQTLTAFPVIGCLKAAETHLGSQLDWKPQSADQQEFLELFFGEGMSNVDLLGESLKSIASTKLEDVCKWLDDNGYDVRPTVEPGPGGFVVASILDVLVEWMELGARRKITNENGTFDGVHLKRSQGANVLQNARVHNHSVVRIATQNGDRVYMTPVDGLPEGRFALESKIRSIMMGLEHDDHRYNGVVFPMVDYDRQPDMSFLQGMLTETVPPGYYIVQAVQQTKFRMNEAGARVESAASMSMKPRGFSSEPPPLVIDQPFLLWIMREGVSIPLFGGIFAEDVWSDPKTVG